MKKDKQDFLIRCFRSNRYCASKSGYIYSVNSGAVKRKKAFVNRRGGYYKTYIGDGGPARLFFYVHHVVWIFFNGRIPQGKQINHKNFIRSDNRLSNLELVTPKENQLHSSAAGRFSRCDSAKLSAVDVVFVRELIKFGLYRTEIARVFSISPRIIYRIERNIGYRWAR